MTYEKLRKHISEKLNPKTKEIHTAIEEIGQHFRNLGFGVPVWHPEKVHSANVGGLTAESYIGYARLEGKWGLLIRTIEYTPENHSFVNQRVYNIESCGNMEIVANALGKIGDLVLSISKAVDRQIEMLPRLESETNELRNPGCEF
jgi:hypothetical protein